MSLPVGGRITIFFTTVSVRVVSAVKVCAFSLSLVGGCCGQKGVTVSEELVCATLQILLVVECTWCDSILGNIDLYNQYHSFESFSQICRWEQMTVWFQLANVLSEARNERNPLGCCALLS